MSLKVFYTSSTVFFFINLFVQVLTQPLDPHMRNLKRQKDCAVRAQSQDNRHYLVSQNNFEQDHFCLKKLIRSNLNMVKLAYTQSHAKGSTGTCLLSSSLWKKQVSRDSSYNRQNITFICEKK